MELLFSFKDDTGSPLIDQTAASEKMGNGGTAIHLAASGNHHQIMDFLKHTMSVGCHEKDKNYDIPYQVMGRCAKEGARTTKMREIF